MFRRSHLIGRLCRHVHFRRRRHTPCGEAAQYVKWANKHDLNIKFELSINPGELSQKNPQKWPFWRDPKNSTQLRIAKKLNFAKQKNKEHLILLKVPEIDFEVNTTFYGEIKIFHFLKKKSKILAVKKFILAWARQGWSIAKKSELVTPHKRGRSTRWKKNFDDTKFPRSCGADWGSKKWVLKVKYRLKLKKLIFW